MFRRAAHVLRFLSRRGVGTEHEPVIAEDAIFLSNESWLNLFNGSEQAIRKCLLVFSQFKFPVLCLRTVI
jgi:hypothetical protein